MTTKKPIEVIMLPTDDRSLIPPFVSIRCDKYGDVDDYPTYRTDSMNGRDTPQYIYITTNGETKEGDWVMSSCPIDGHKEIFKYSRGIPLSDDLFKIIATTDKSLKIKDFPELDNSATRSLPSISQSFIKEFVANPNGKWEIECYIQDFLDKEGGVFYERYLESIKLDKYNTVTITPVEEKIYSREEIISFGKKCAEFGYENELDNEGQLTENWIKENL